MVDELNVHEADESTLDGLPGSPAVESPPMAARVPKVAPESAAGRTRRSWDVLIALVRADLRDSRDLTPVGVIKWLLEPLAAMVTYFMLIVVMLHRGGHAYPVFLMCALLPWRYLQGVITSGMNLLPNYANIITARAIPRMVLPMVLIITEGLNFVVALVLMAPLMRIYGVHPTLALLWLPAIVAVLVVLVSGFAYLAAVFGIYFPDYRSTVANSSGSDSSPRPRSSPNIRSKATRSPASSSSIPPRACSTPSEMCSWTGRRPRDTSAVPVPGRRRSPPRGCSRLQMA